MVFEVAIPPWNDKPASTDHSAPQPNHCAHHPIHNLPVELLIRVFSTLTASPAHRNAHAVLSGVCRAWRAIVLSTPTLWANITITRNPNWVALSLHRSKRAPLALHVHDMMHLVPIAHILSPHGTRVVSASLVRVPAYALHAAQHLLSHLTQGAIRELHLQGELAPYQRCRFGDAAPTVTNTSVPTLSSPPEWFPELRVLELDRIVPRFKGPLARLQRLSFRHYVPGVVPIATLSGGFLRTLQRCPVLEELEIVDGLGAVNFSGLEDGVDVPPEPVSLSRLRVLTVREPRAADVAGLLGSLDVPAEADVSLSLHRMPTTDAPWNAEQSLSTMLAMLPRDVKRLPLLECVRRVRVLFSELPLGREARLEGCADIGDGKISLSIQEDSPSSCANPESSKSQLPFSTDALRHAFPFIEEVHHV